MKIWQSLASLGRFTLAKFVGAAVVAGLIGNAAPHYMQHQIDGLWVDGAHQALLEALVDARHYSWNHSKATKLCMADNNKKCVSDEHAAADNNKIAGWLVYSAGSSEELVAFHSFRSEPVGFTGSTRFDWSLPIGFDAQGYSLQTEVVSFDIYSVSGVNSKTYKIIIEPSGALQTLVNADKNNDVHIALSSWPEKQKTLSAAL